MIPNTFTKLEKYDSTFSNTPFKFLPKKTNPHSTVIIA